ncbi:membrane protein [Clostridia bacterium]|nr:membrane protein [Clostridia bacterium]
MMTEEKNAPHINGMAMLLLNILLIIGAVAGFVAAIGVQSVLIGVVTGLYFMVVGPIFFGGLKILKPNDALVLTLFGTYYGTLRGAGFFFVNPFTRGNKISLKTMTLDNDKQKINDQMGNPIIIGIVVIWRVVNTAKAVFCVDNYKEFLSIQCDSALRNTVRLYPYDIHDGGGDESSLRGSSLEVAQKIQKEIQEKVEPAGLEIVEARITHLAYAPEIAASMLQRQQASAIIDARQMIVDGAVGMVEMALAKLSEKKIVNLDEERKAAMVSNLLVVLCGNKDAQPIVNSGSLY